MGFSHSLGQTRTSSLGPARPLPPSNNSLLCLYMQFASATADRQNPAATSFSSLKDFCLPPGTRAARHALALTVFQTIGPLIYKTHGARAGRLSIDQQANSGRRVARPAVQKPSARMFSGALKHDRFTLKRIRRWRSNWRTAEVKQAARRNRAVHARAVKALQSPRV